MNHKYQIINQYPNLTHAYYIDNHNGEVNIDTSNFAKSLTDIKNTILSQDENLIVRHSVYPNGFEILFIQEPDNIEIRTNYPLEMDSNGIYQVKLN